MENVCTVIQIRLGEGGGGGGIPLGGGGVGEPRTGIIHTDGQAETGRDRQTRRHTCRHSDIQTTDYRTYRQMICLKICSSDEALNPHPKP